MKQGKLGILLQARVSSSRLPGKVLMPLPGPGGNSNSEANPKPMVQWIFERLKRIEGAEICTVVTSKDPTDDPLADFLKSHSIPYYRGSLDDVLLRYLDCARKLGLTHIVRATGDNPFVDPFAGTSLIAAYLNSNAQYMSAFPQYGSKLPLGVGLEIFSTKALEEAHDLGVEPHHREHVNEYFQENPERFGMETWLAPKRLQAPELSLTVDTAEDFKRALDLYTRYFHAFPQESWVDTEWAILNGRAQ